MARVWDLRATDPSASQRVLPGYEYNIYAVAFSPDGQYLATASDNPTTQVWDLRATDPSASPRILYGHKSTINAVAFSPDGRYPGHGKC